VRRDVVERESEGATKLLAVHFVATRAAIAPSELANLPWQEHASEPAPRPVVAAQQDLADDDISMIAFRPTQASGAITLQQSTNNRRGVDCGNDTRLGRPSSCCPSPRDGLSLRRGKSTCAGSTGSSGNLASAARAEGFGARQSSLHAAKTSKRHGVGIEQRREIHVGGRTRSPQGRTRGRGGRNPGQGRRRRHTGGDARIDLRPLRAIDADVGSIGRRPGRRPHLGASARRDARRDGNRPQRWGRKGQRIRGAVADHEQTSAAGVADVESAATVASTRRGQGRHRRGQRRQPRSTRAGKDSNVPRRRTVPPR
jgi:hypothetical protein